MGSRLIPSTPPHQTDGEYSQVTERGMDLDVGESLAEDGVYANGGNDAFRLGFVGAGNLAESIAHGIAAPGVLPASAIRAAPHRRPERGAAFASLGATILASNTRVVDDSDVIVISVKPQIVKQVLVEVKPLLSEEKLLVSIAVGIKMKDLQDWSGERQIIALDCESLLLLGHGIV